MRTFFAISLSVLGILLCVTTGVAQEKNEESKDYFEEFSDYSYLWENEKKKSKKKKNSKQKPKVETETDVDETTDNQNRSDVYTPPADTINVKAVETDSVKQEENITEQPPIIEYKVDSLIEETESIDPLVDSTASQKEIEQDVEDDETDIGDDDEVTNEKSLVKDEKPKKEKKKKERKEIKPLGPDFRSGFESSTGDGSIDAGFTYTNINGENFVGLNLSPEFKIGKLGVGLDVPVLYNLDKQELRTEIFKSGIGVVRLINYVSYGTQKKDPVFIKVGQLNNVMLGYGGLMNHYTNSTNFERRKVGLHADVNYKGLIGLEALYSDFDASSVNLMAFRPYAHPLLFLNTPIIRTLEVGYQLIIDDDDTSPETTTFSNTGNIKAFGLDIGMRVLNTPFINIDVFATHSTLDYNDGLNSILTSDGLSNQNFDKSSGSSVGVNFRFKLIKEVFSTDVRIERLTYNNNYIPQFFNATYELNKDARISSLISAVEKKGIYGSLQGHVLKKIQLGGSLLIPDDITAASPAVVQVNATAERLADKISLFGTYFKGDLTDLSDAFTLDQRSIVKLRVGYHVNKYIVAGLDYFWSFQENEAGNFEAQRYVSPYFGLSIPL